MEHSYDIHNIVWEHTLELSKWNHLLGQSLDEAFRYYFHPLLPKDIHHNMTPYNPFENEHLTPISFGSEYEPQFDPTNDYENENENENEYDYEFDLNSSDDEDEEYYELD